MRLAPQTSIFARMTALARACNAINLAQGLMELSPDPALLQELSHQAVGPVHQYTLPAGLPALREVVSYLSQHYFGTPYDPETEVTITVGATEAIYTAIAALSEPGDPIVFLEPAYDSYLPAIQMANARPIPLRLREPTFSLPWEELDAAFRRGARLCLLNFPHNPTGRRLYPDDLLNFRQLAERHPQVIFIIDEAYELMVWEPDEPLPARPLSLRQDPLLRERSILIGSLGKLLGMTGWRLGYTLAPPPLTTPIRTVRQFISFCAPSPLQTTAAAYLQTHIDRATYFHPTLLQRRQLTKTLLAQYTAFPPLTCEGSYFFLLPIRDYTDERDAVLAERLTQAYGVATIPLSPFYHDGYDPGYLRLCFARPEEVLTEGIRRLGQAFPPKAPPNGHPL
jgi:methionine aminotransferase